MEKNEREKLIGDIIRALIAKRVSDPAIDSIKSAISQASIRPLRVLFECCTSDGVSTEVLAKKYGYKQAPRAARDLRELGFKLKTTPARTSDGRRMARYSIEDFEGFLNRSGRRAFTKYERLELLRRQKSRCFYCCGEFQSNELQVDHRIPYEVAGNAVHERDGVSALILVCSSCNRRKSWSCESCVNFAARKPHRCESCYWFNPDDYKHIAEKKRALVNATFDKNERGYKRFAGKSRAEVRKILEE